MTQQQTNSIENADDTVSNSKSSEITKNEGVLGKVLQFFIRNKNGDSLREVIEEYMEEMEDISESPSFESHERSLISNVLKLRNTTVVDVMIPRADIAAIEMNAGKEELVELLKERQFSRIPVYKETLDDIIGVVHIKDIVLSMAENKELDITALLRPIPIIVHSLPVLDLLVKMKNEKRHMAMIVDEYGGIDGLVTIGDVITAIVGEFEDEFDTTSSPQLIKKPDGTVIADGRVDIEEFEEEFGSILSEDEREQVDTLAGLVFYTISRVPARGEVIKHESGMIFEILESDQRSIHSLRIRNIPQKKEIEA